MLFSRRRFLKGALAAVPGGLGYAHLLEPHWLEVKRTSVRVAGRPLPGPVRILQLSDFHLSTDVPLSLIARAVSLGIAGKPDLICVTGDFFTGLPMQEEAYAAELRRLTAAAPAFATMGNHDGGAWSARYGGEPDSGRVRAFAAGAGFDVLHNRSQVVCIGETKLRLTGLGDLWAGEFKPADAFWDVNSEMTDAHVVMSHNPDSKDELKDFGWDLMLSGHTHGGQASLPFIGGGMFAPVRDRRFISGRYDWNGRQLYVTRGVGSIHGLRFNCRPEVTLLDLA